MSNSTDFRFNKSGVEAIDRAKHRLNFKSRSETLNRGITLLNVISDYPNAKIVLKNSDDKEIEITM